MILCMVQGSSMNFECFNYVKDHNPTWYKMLEVNLLSKEPKFAEILDR